MVKFGRYGVREDDKIKDDLYFNHEDLSKLTRYIAAEYDLKLNDNAFFDCKTVDEIAMLIFNLKK
jgi:hypothetical protein